MRNARWMAPLITEQILRRFAPQDDREVVFPVNEAPSGAFGSARPPRSSGRFGHSEVPDGDDPTEGRTPEEAGESEA
jgi:hypothetical protein